MRKPASEIHPKDLITGDRVTIADGSGNMLTGLVRTGVSDNQLERWVTMKAFGKDFKVATWEAGRRRWTTYFPITHKELALF
jgi:hypothetical protein